MKSFPLNIIQPKILNGKSINSWFTLAHQEMDQSDRNIPGLNLGLNTGEDEEIVLKNRRLLLNELNLNEEKIAFGNQVHKTNVQVVDAGGIYPDTDAFVTNKPGMALAIQVADCAAILLGDPVNDVIGAAHAGWRGAVAEILPKTISKMKELGAHSQYIYAYISPCISEEKFEVGEEVAEQFPQQFVDLNSYDKPHINLKGFLKNQMKEAGILESTIETDGGCTFSEERFYSYRRQNKKSGRMMGIIRLNG